MKKRHNISFYLRRRMRAFLNAQGVNLGTSGMKSRDLKKMVAERLGLTLSVVNVESDMQVYEALADGPKSPPRKKLIRDFYQTDAWFELRYRALKLHGARCQCCGVAGEPGNPLQVDHIKPRSKYPELESDLTNLQVLCRNCNQGKRAWDETDWRDNVVPIRA